MLRVCRFSIYNGVARALTDIVGPSFLFNQSGDSVRRLLRPGSVWGRVQPILHRNFSVSQNCQLI